MTIPDVNRCDEIARAVLTFESDEPISLRRVFIESISSYRYEGSFEDEGNLIIGPKYRMLFASDCMTEAEHCQAFEFGLSSNFDSLKTAA